MGGEVRSAIGRNSVRPPIRRELLVVIVLRLDTEASASTYHQYPRIDLMRALCLVQNCAVRYVLWDDASMNHDQARGVSRFLFQHNHAVSQLLLHPRGCWPLATGESWADLL
jgi:hypothetical protein